MIAQQLPPREPLVEGEVLGQVAHPGPAPGIAEAAAEETGVDCEIVDIRTISPLDVDTITASVNKTGRCIVVHEATRFAGFGAEIVARIQKDCFYNLEAPIRRTAGWDTPYPHAFEWQYFPGKKRLVADIRRMMEEE